MIKKVYKNQLISNLKNQNLLFRTYKQIFGKKFVYVLFEISKIFNLKIEYSKMAELEIELVKNIESLKYWKKVFSNFITSGLGYDFWENISIFLFCSWVIKKIKSNNFLSFYEQKRRKAFNKITFFLIDIESSFNIKILAMLKKWK